MTWRRLITPHGRDVVFDVVVHVAWADGRLSPLEVSAIRSTAEALGLATHDLGAAILGRRGRAFESLELGSLGPLERAFAYGAAVWISVADRHVARSEYQTIRRIGRALGLSDELASRVELLAWGVGCAELEPEQGMQLERMFGTVTDALLGHGAFGLPTRGLAHAEPAPHTRIVRRG